jgi:hypothetical protein
MYRVSHGSWWTSAFSRVSSGHPVRARARDVDVAPDILRETISRFWCFLVSSLMGRLHAGVRRSPYARDHSRYRRFLTRRHRGMLMMMARAYFLAIAQTIETSIACPILRLTLSALCFLNCQLLLAKCGETLARLSSAGKKTHYLFMFCMLCPILYWLAWPLLEQAVCPAYRGVQVYSLHWHLKFRRLYIVIIINSPQLWQWIRRWSISLVQQLRGNHEPHVSLKLCYSLLDGVWRPVLDCLFPTCNFHQIKLLRYRSNLVLKTLGWFLWSNKT